jgi:hypothetical protein
MFKDKFIRYFTSSKRQFKYEYHLKSVTQGERKHLRDYIIRFNKEALEVKEVAPNMILFFLMEGLKPSFFKHELTGNKPQNMEELKDRAELWIRIEDQSKASGDPMPIQVKVEDKSAKAAPNSKKPFDSRIRGRGLVVCLQIIHLC